jgi:hypothetical protein
VLTHSTQMISSLGRCLEGCDDKRLITQTAEPPKHHETLPGLTLVLKKIEEKMIGHTNDVTERTQ